MQRPRLLWPLILGVLLASCAQPTRTPSDKPSVPPPAAADTSGADVYSFNADESQIHILVYRGGRLARLGHNHTVSSRDIRGRAWVHPQFNRSGFELSIPVQALVVDDPDARGTQGADFSGSVPQKDVEGTRKNMLGAEVLDAQRFPEILLRSARVDGSLRSPSLIAQVTIRGVTREMQIPIALTLDGTRLTATGAFDLLQTDFGMKPFSIAFGALEVQDRLHLEYRITAERES